MTTTRTADAVLQQAYWALREHASSYRGAQVFRRARERWEADRDDERKYSRYVIHEWYARGIEAAARDIAELMGVPEFEIDRAPVENGEGAQPGPD